MNHPNNTTSRLLAAASILGLAVLAACAPGYPANFCHATGDPANPYELITITGTDAAVHLQHPGAGPAPVEVAQPPWWRSTMARSRSAATSSETNPYRRDHGASTGRRHTRRRSSVPDGGCPRPVPLGTAPSSDGKVTICHAGSSRTYNEITVSVNGKTDTTSIRPTSSRRP
jgi:hypothetical protein